jgi:hypothetical protein
VAKPAPPAAAPAKAVEAPAAEKSPAVSPPAPVEPKPAVAETAPAKAAEPPKPVVPPPPPPPSAAFHAWVENLQIRGVRGGAVPRIFIGSSSYQRGDLVNPQLGITFESYNDTTRVLTFRDKTGAKVERRH